MTRPFRVLGVQQIAIGGPSKAALRGLWVDLFGVPVTGTFRSERENVDEDILALAGVEIDLMQPIDPEAKPKVHEPRLNHIGLWIDDLPAAVAPNRPARTIRISASGSSCCVLPSNRRIASSVSS